MAGISPDDALFSHDKKIDVVAIERARLDEIHARNRKLDAENHTLRVELAEAIASAQRLQKAVEEYVLAKNTPSP